MTFECPIFSWLFYSVSLVVGVSISCLVTLCLTSSRSNSHILFIFNLYYYLLKFLKTYRMCMQYNIKIKHQKFAIDYIFSFIKSYMWTYLGHIKLIGMTSICSILAYVNSVKIYRFRILGMFSVILI